MAGIGMFSRMGLIVAAMATIATTAPAFASNHVTPTTSATAVASDVIVIDFTSAAVDRFDFLAPLADLSIPAAIPGSDQRPTFKPAAIKQRASRSAVRPTAIAGWRSGRTRHLAVA
jgi:hypothetical protein